MHHAMKMESLALISIMWQFSQDKQDNKEYTIEYRQVTGHKATNVHVLGEYAQCKHNFLIPDGNERRLSNLNILHNSYIL
jgi:hypothetical protein